MEELDVLDILFSVYVYFIVVYSYIAEKVYIV